MSDLTLTPSPAQRILRGMQRHFAQGHGIGSVAEVTLATGRRVDLMAIDRKGLVWVIEVKSSLADFRSDRKWPEYGDYCDCFAFAVAPEFPLEVLPPGIGLFVSDGFDADLLTPPVVTPLPAARRKAVTLRYALTAAARLGQIEAPPP